MTFLPRFVLRMASSRFDRLAHLDTPSSAHRQHQCICFLAKTVIRVVIRLLRGAEA